MTERMDRTLTDEERAVMDDMADLIRDQVYDPWNNTPEAIAEALTAAGFRRTVQGEPSCDHDWQNRVGGGSKCRKCDLWQDKRVPTQGEPTDAQVLAALNTLNPRASTDNLDDWAKPNRDAIRAALRAAYATKEGESHGA